MAYALNAAGGKVRTSPKLVPAPTPTPTPTPNLNPSSSRSPNPNPNPNPTPTPTLPLPPAKVKTSLKLVLRGAEERVVGLHCIGPFSDEMMQACAAHAHGMCSTCTRHVHVMYHVRGMCISCSCSCHVHGICIDAYVYVHGCPSR